MNPTTILWIYIVLLFVGGLVGYLKAGSKASLIMSASFAAVLILCASGRVLQPQLANAFADIILAVLLVFFAVRVTKSKRFMPNGMMAVLTLATLALRNIRF